MHSFPLSTGHVTLLRALGDVAQALHNSPGGRTQEIPKQLVLIVGKYFFEYTHEQVLNRLVRKGLLERTIRGYVLTTPKTPTADLSGQVRNYHPIMSIGLVKRWLENPEDPTLGLRVPDILDSGEIQRK